jgi:putative tricarboxylic transport membrane protein
MVGAYGIGEVFTRLYHGYGSAAVGRVDRLRTDLPRLSEIGAVRASLARGSLVGVVVGLVPGAGATIASFVAYGAEGQYGRRRRELGSGIPEGIVAPQTAATSSVGGAMIPLLTMGIPGSGATAIILGAFLLHGVQPGPQIFADPAQARMVYAVFASMFVGVLGMCLLGYFAIKLLVRVLEFPEAVVSAFVVMFCFIGAFAARNNLSDLYVIAAFGVLGFLCERFRFPIAPLVLGTILGPLAENTFMTTMISFDNDWTVFFTRPVAGIVMVLSLAALGYPALRHLRAQRKIAA